ncbi:hypothetical protein OPV22_023744 [Ensete ventricosum]|uniref:X8 domain-containing protein n=1 Tax=Ensete ventricosum TaxID=4639 RepID=A0AAV8QTM8_ENSVE|nr:hypothetical protein OPV22_023744 [Ensete ventricosum]
MAKVLSSCGLLALIVLMSSIIPTESRDVGVYRQVARTWCIANPLAKPAALQSDVDRLCGGDVDCSSIQSGGVCFAPNTVADHASVVYNLYYKSHQSQPSACSFGDNTLTTVSDPSHGSCIFP